MPLTTKKFFLYFFVPAVFLNLFVWVYFFRTQNKPEEAKKELLACDVKGFRRQGFHYTKPLLMLDRACDDPALEPLRTKVLSFVDDAQQHGKVEKASVYFRLLDSGKNFIVHEDSYSPGSMLKILTLITYLKTEEKNPGTLRKRVLFSAPFANMPMQTVGNFNHVQVGKEYTIGELLECMIVYSDNNATALLNQRIDGAIYNQMLAALNLPIPSPTQTDYPLTTESMSRFFRLLYNSSFLDPELSDKALELLTKSEYNNGLTRYIGDKMSVAHKFGEKNIDGVFQLHEGGIFFTGSLDYVLIVMTRGKKQEAMADFIADVSKLIVDNLVSNYGISITKTAELTDVGKGFDFPVKDATNSASSSTTKW